MNWKPYFLALTPFLLGTIVSIIIDTTGNNTIYGFAISSNYFSFIVSLQISILLLIAVTVWDYQSRSSHDKLDHFQKSVDLDKQKFFNRLNHELKNPLTSLRFGLENYASSEGAEREKAFDSVELQVNRLTHLTRGIQKLAEMNKANLNLSQIDLSELLNEIMELIEGHPGAPYRTIELDLPKKPWVLSTITADYDLISLAIYNLVENAIKFTKEGSGIEIRVRDNMKNVVIQVADTGPGIKEDELDFIWEELYRGFQNRLVPGSGLGLSLVKAIVELHEGEVIVSSRIGEGSIFSITLPVNTST